MAKETQRKSTQARIRKQRVAATLDLDRRVGNTLFDAIRDFRLELKDRLTTGRVATAWEQGSITAALGQVEFLETAFKNNLDGTIREIYADAYASTLTSSVQAAKALGLGEAITIPTLVPSAATLAAIQQVATQQIAGMAADAKNKIRSIITRSVLPSGPSPFQSMTAIDKILTGDITSKAALNKAISARQPWGLSLRAEMIFRTETATVSETAAQHAQDVFAGELSAAGLPVPRKRWLDAGDNRVRSGHAAASQFYADAPIPFDQPFLVAAKSGQSKEQLMHPLDSSLGATAGNIVNCRCISEEVLDEVFTAIEQL